MSTSKHHLMYLAGALLVLATLACNAPAPATPTATPTAPRVERASPTSPPTPVATDTPVPDVSGPGGCTLNAAYVADVTVPDDAEFAPGATFTKVWRVRNSGTCAWEMGTQLAFVSGERMGGPAAVDIPQAAPGSQTDVSVDLVAPTEPGTHRGNWQLRAPDGGLFGSVIYVRIAVVVTPTPTQTPTPTITFTPTVTPTATPTTPTVPAPFSGTWEELGGEEGALGSPTGEAAMGRWMADQRFEHGYVYWRNNEDSAENVVYVLYYLGGINETQGIWERYEDTWTEDMDELSCPEADTPNGPFRGFGKVWCDHAAVRLGLGAATEQEGGAHAGFQDFEGGTLLWTSRLNFLYALFTDGTWRRFEESP